jgi:hypothetical protein
MSAKTYVLVCGHVARNWRWRRQSYCPVCQTQVPCVERRAA